MFSIAFICTANLCRSVMAHAISVPELAKRGWSVEVYSAGILDLTGTAPAVPTWIACCQNSTPPVKDGATFVRDLPLSTINRFFVMEQQHAQCLITEYGIPISRITLLGSFDPKRRGEEIKDPMNQGSVIFDQCYTLIRDCLMNYFNITTEIPETPNHDPNRTGGSVSSVASDAILPTPRKRRGGTTGH